ncbi:isocitrate lyase/PEP mutase family protein [Nostoc sp. FACHB-152]|uniref:isocitrate lyase/PEP mutase family protein n=1 Tax=unclassified Nostoc TaxID=2593658 RepID=UPI00168297C0|nr:MULTISPECIES: isocitrate lyase/PEP mutase family protein [unclassified Nostoc]MBD2451017.1 isocitrate lyase/PEP mutase family protein [Nostoc sp. FACHB-152]MBD2472085.1 isocitrate lyase/PEP mutase family protein [Nostoc sp. FACHB-145]
MTINSGQYLRHAISERSIIPFIGVYDVFSASIASQYFDGIFISGFGFAASYYGLPDIGFIAWSDIVNFVQRVRTILPHHHIVVDIDDGYTDTEVACHVVNLLESVGASAVVLEDQMRPRRCGHFDGKQLMELEPFLEKLKKVLASRKDLFVIARTDASDLDEIIKRAKAFAEVGADAILADGLRDLNTLKILKAEQPKPIMFNQIAGGKSPQCSLPELEQFGVSLVNYSTPCLFAAQSAIHEMMQTLKVKDGLLLKDKVGVKECTELLNQNLIKRSMRNAY